MRVLFVSRDLSAGDLCYRMKKEGNEVKLFVYEKKQKQNLEGIVEKTSNWRKELDWVGKDGLIIFDSTGYGRIQDRLRKKGFSVVGGCEIGDRVEDDRDFGEKAFQKCGISTIPSKSFRSLDKAIAFVKKEKGMWVVKQNAHVSKIFNYVGQLDDGRDVVEMLKAYKQYNQKDAASIQLQKRVFGVEIGVARYFNGDDWVGPIEMNIEHKSLCTGGLGPKTYEMGTLMWYDEDEKNILFQKTLERFKPYLKKYGFHGDIDIDCIVNKEGVFPLEATARFGSPATQLQATMHHSPWGEFLKAVADKKPYDLSYRKGFGIVALISAPPFPYTAISDRYSVRGSKIFFRSPLSPEEEQRIHIEEVSRDADGDFVISGEGGFIMHVSGFGATVAEAQAKTYALAEKIIIPKKFYRIDIGEKFIKKDAELLKRWGYLSKDFSW